MKNQVTKLFLGLGLAALALAAAPAHARSTTAFSAFHVELTGTTTTNYYLCLTENNGAVVNNCSTPVSLEFDLPIDNPYNHTIDVQNYWGGTAAQETFNCVSYAYTGTGGGTVQGGTAGFTAPGLNLATTVDVYDGATSLQVICWNIPVGGGVANFNWNP